VVVDGRADKPLTHIAVDRVSKTYTLKKDVVESIRELSFDVARGGFLSVVGPSGCGKSTLLMMVAGLLPITSGMISIDGDPVGGPRRETSMMLQTPTLLPWRSVLANVMFPIEIQKGDRQAFQHEALKLLEVTGILEFKDRLPEQLSGGMAQRVALCRALITNPELLLMDEPFSALDALTRDDMSLELQRIWERFRKTVIFITHSIREGYPAVQRLLCGDPRQPGALRPWPCRGDRCCPRGASAFSAPWRSPLPCSWQSASDGRWRSPC
jgi:NitT/TauT family transport system ATP-binding protein